MLKTVSDLYSAKMGLEKESHRITPDGMLSNTPHPFQNNPEIKMDFSEDQIEIATKPCDSADSLYNELYSLHYTVTKEIQKQNELLWCLSNPPLFINEDNIHIAQFDDPEETEFRELLASKYGKKVMLYSGIHYNFSFGEPLIQELYKTSSIFTVSSYREFKDKLYLSVAKNCFKYIWFLVYLTAASPVYHESFADGENLYGGKFCGYASMRNSPLGYQNKNPLPLDYSSSENYVKQIRALVDNKKLMHISELYAPVRIKAKKGHSTKAILNDGIEFLELRVFDLNPFSPCGFAKEDIEFLHLFMIYMLSLEDFDFDYNQQQIAEKNRHLSAKLDAYNTYLFIDGKDTTLKDATIQFSNNMLSFYKSLKDEYAIGVLKRVFNRIYKPEKRYAVRLVNQNKEYISNGIRLTQQQAEML